MIRYNRLRSAKIIVFWYDYCIYADKVKGVTLAGDCYVESFNSKIKNHNIVDVVDSYDEFRINEEAGKYNK